MSEEKKMYALVQWVGGDYNETFTPGVPIDWIRDFTLEKFDPNEDPDVSYVIEWLENKKNNSKKIRRWKCYYARVIAVSKSTKKLEKMMKEKNCEISPLRPNSLPAGQKEKENLTQRTLEPELQNLDESLEDEASTSQHNGKKRKNDEESTPGLKKIRHSDHDAHATSPDSEDSSEDSGLSNRKIHKENKAIKKLLSKVYNELKGITTVQREMMRHSRDGNDNEQKELGHRGSGVFLPMVSWKTANAQTTYQSMGNCLVNAIFPKEVLLRSNLRGKRSKINKDAPIRLGLDPIKMAAIEESVRDKFPNFKKSILGASINNMLNDKRRKNEVDPILNNFADGAEDN